MNIRRWAVTFAVGVSLLSGMLVTAGAVTAQDSTPENQQTFPVNITFLNAMTALDEVDVYINGDEDEQRVVEGLDYGAVSDVFEGTAPVTGVLIKKNVDVGFDQYLFNTIVPTEAGKDYLVVISDVWVIPTEFDVSPLSGNQARARAIHAAAQAPSVDIYASEAGATTALTDLVPIVRDLQYGQAGEGGEINAGSFDVKLTATGTDTVAAEVDGLTVDAGQVYSFVIIGTPGDTDKPLTIVPVSVPAGT